MVIKYNQASSQSRSEVLSQCHSNALMPSSTSESSRQHMPDRRQCESDLISPCRVGERALLQLVLVLLRPALLLDLEHGVVGDLPLGEAVLVFVEHDRAFVLDEAALRERPVERKERVLSGVRQRQNTTLRALRRAAVDSRRTVES